MEALSLPIAPKSKVMKTLSLLLLLAVIPTLSQGEELDPTLAPLAATHRTQIGKLLADKEAAISGVRANYIVALREADEAAATKGDLAFQEVLDKELEAVNGGVLPPLPPANLPRKLQVPRRTFQKADERSDDELAKAVKQLNANYAIALGKLEVAKDGGEELRKQIAGERKRVLSLRIGPLSNLQLEIAGTDWQSVDNPEGYLRFNERGKVNGTWPYTTPKPDEVVVHWNDKRSTTFTLDRTGRILMEKGQPSNVLVPKPIE